MPSPARFERRFTVTAADIDRLGHVNNVVYLQWVQDVAGSHWEHTASSEEREQIVWVAVRHEIDYKAPAFEGDEILARTWVERWSGVKSERHTEIRRMNDDTLLAKAVTIWAAIDPETGRPQRLERTLKARFVATVVALVLSASSCAQEEPAPWEVEAWLAGDHHIHSRYSVGWDRQQEPPAPIVAGDAIYPIAMNATMARHFGLSWMVATDHGGPNHSRVSLELAYPELLQSREVVPEVVQFFGMEFDTPGADHSSLIVPHTHDEADRLHQIESSFSRREPWPVDPRWDSEPRMLEALGAMSGFPDPPVVIANHPSRSAPGLGEYGLYTPAELRDWNDTAPEVAVGMAGAPGHQARTISRDGSLRPQAPRGAYGNHPTYGGFDQLTARLGGFWDSMLGEGRRWWITANSDSHVNWREGGGDFWPGEYSKTYVWAAPTHLAILEGIRAGRIFVTTGDLISALEVTASSGRQTADIGGRLEVGTGDDAQITIRLVDPTGPNSHGDDPEVARVDLIVGEVTGPVSDRTSDTNPTTRVERRWTRGEWERDGNVVRVTHRLEGLTGDLYLRVRGTSGTELEPEPDPRGEDPWTDLWFYSNPVFISVR